ncbi:MAG: lysophospholipid acyltransferase family protein [Candidatus Kapaibacterium sp.]
MNKLRGIVIVTTTFVASLLFLPIYVVIRNDAFFYATARIWAKCMCKLGNVRLTIRGNNTTQPEPCIYICNHRSLFDIPCVLASITDDIRIMYKHELNRIPVFGWILALSPFIAVNRADAKDAVASIDMAVEQIREGASVLLFPEGTWSTTRDVLPFKRGAVVLAARSGKQVIPVAISGTEKIVPPDTYTFTSGAVTISMGENVIPPPLPGRTEEKQFTEELRSKVIQLLQTI